jgi:hypothetical protein
VPVLIRLFFAGRKLRATRKQHFAAEATQRYAPTQVRRQARSLGTAQNPRVTPQPDQLSPQSQSLSQSYGSVLPTSLTYIFLSTRGCSPWRPAADIGYGLARESHSLTRIFKGRPKHSGHHKSRGALRILHPYLRANRFQGLVSLQRKDNSPQGFGRRLRARLRYRSCTRRHSLRV